jgi:hypothetical protein
MSEATSGNDVAASSPLPDFASLTRATEQTKRRMRNAVRRRPYPPQLALRRAPCRVRSPSGVPPRLCPWDSRIPRCRSRTMFRGASAQDGGGFPPAPAPVTASTSHAGRNAGRLMSETARGTACKAARGHRPRPMIRLASGPPPHRGEDYPLSQTETKSSQSHRINEGEVETAPLAPWGKQGSKSGSARASDHSQQRSHRACRYGNLQLMFRRRPIRRRNFLGMLAASRYPPARGDLIR